MSTGDLVAVWHASPTSHKKDLSFAEILVALEESSPIRDFDELSDDREVYEDSV